MNTEQPEPIPMLLWCPACGQRHIDRHEFATKPHHTHACQICGHVWRPAIVPTVGVHFLPGFKDEDEKPLARVEFEVKVHPPSDSGDVGTEDTK